MMCVSSGVRRENRFMNAMRPIEIISRTVKGYDGLKYLADMTKLNILAKFFRDILFTSWPCKTTLPEYDLRPERTRSNAVLPLPLGPINETRQPEGILSDKSFRMILFP